MSNTVCVPSDVPFGEMTDEQKDVLRMWYALRLPVQWRSTRRVKDDVWQDERFFLEKGFNFHADVCFRLRPE